MDAQLSTYLRIRFSSHPAGKELPPIIEMHSSIPFDNAMQYASAAWWQMYVDEDKCGTPFDVDGTYRVDYWKAPPSTPPFDLASIPDGCVSMSLANATIVQVFVAWVNRGKDPRDDGLPIDFGG